MVRSIFSEIKVSTYHSLPAGILASPKRKPQTFARAIRNPIEATHCQRSHERSEKYFIRVNSDENISTPAPAIRIPTSNARLSGQPFAAAGRGAERSEARRAGGKTVVARVLAGPLPESAGSRRSYAPVRFFLDSLRDQAFLGKEKPLWI